MRFIVTYLGMLITLINVNSAEGADKNKKEARAAFKQGVSLFDEGAYAEAAKSFRRANELYPKWTILYNIAQSETAAKNYGVAYELFEQYLAAGGDDVTESRRKEIVKELDRLTSLVGSVEIEAAPDGSEIWIDELKRGAVPLPGRLLISIGTVHKIEIVHAGQTIHQADVKVIRGETAVVSLKEEDEAKPTGGLAPTEGLESTTETDPMDYAPEKQRDPKALIGWVSAGAGAVFLIAGGVTGGLALARNSKLKDRCADKQCDQKDKDYSMGRDLLAISSNVAIGIGAAAAVTGVVLLVLSKRSKDHEGDDSEATVSVAPSVFPHFTGLSITGSY